MDAKKNLIKAIKKDPDEILNDNEKLKEITSDNELVKQLLEEKDVTKLEVTIDGEPHYMYNQTRENMKNSTFKRSIRGDGKPREMQQF